MILTNARTEQIGEPTNEPTKKKKKTKFKRMNSYGRNEMKEGGGRKCEIEEKKKKKDEAVGGRRSSIQHMQAKCVRASV